MRAVSGGLSAGPSSRSAFGWLQAGSIGIAYRLAHLSLPRAIVVVALLIVFYLS
jgi:hypothetical protein